VTNDKLDAAIVRLEGRIDAAVARLEGKIAESKFSMLWGLGIVVAVQVITHFWR
jgi:hypothetical protein